MRQLQVVDGSAAARDRPVRPPARVARARRISRRAGGRQPDRAQGRSQGNASHPRHELSRVILHLTHSLLMARKLTLLLCLLAGASTAACCRRTDAGNLGGLRPLRPADRTAHQRRSGADAPHFSGSIRCRRTGAPKCCAGCSRRASSSSGCRRATDRRRSTCPTASSITGSGRCSCRASASKKPWR